MTSCKAKIIETEYSESRVTTDIGTFYAHPSELAVFDWVGQEVDISRLPKNTGGYAYIITCKNGDKARTKKTKISKTDYVKAHKEFLEQEFKDLVKKAENLKR